MKNINKALPILMASLIVMTSLAGCSSKNETSSSSSSSSQGGQGSQSVPNDASGGNSGDKVYKIGVIQFMEHNALDASYKGFVDGLAEAGYVDGKNIKLQHLNAQGEIPNCQTISEKLVNDNSDLILAIATPAAQAAANATETIPILVTAVTDPAKSALVKDNNKPGGNVSGTSDLTPVKEQLELLKQLIPGAKKIGLLYSSSEANSGIQIEIAKIAAAEMGLETVDYTVSSQNEVQQVVTSMLGKVDAVYTPTDNMIAIAMPTIGDILSTNKVPIIVGEGAVVETGGLATYGISYYNIGKQTAVQAVKILKGEAKPADMPIEYVKDTELVINKTYADKIGLEIPKELLDKAVIVE